MNSQLDCRQDHVLPYKWQHQWIVQALLTRLIERQCQGEIALAYIADRWSSKEAGRGDVLGADGQQLQTAAAVAACITDCHQ